MHRYFQILHRPISNTLQVVVLMSNKKIVVPVNKHTLVSMIAIADMRYRIEAVINFSSKKLDWYTKTCLT